MTTKKNGYISVDNAIALLFPIGGLLYIDGDADPNVLYEGSTWQLIGQDRCIMGAGGAHTVGQTVEAGLPNIYGKFSTGAENKGQTATGAFSVVSNSEHRNTDGEWNNQRLITFDASKYNSIYGSSTTVQPPAYFVNIWKRIA